MLPKGHPFKGLPFFLAVSDGELPQFEVVQIFARNNDIGATEEDIWENGGVYVWPTSAATVSVVSDDAADDLTGTGARKVRIRGLDINYNEIEETVDMDGLTPVVTTQQFFRVNDTRVLDAGSSEANVGAITGTHSGNPFFYIEPGDGLAHQSMYTIPAGMNAFLIDVQSWQGKDSSSDIAFWHKHPGESWVKQYHMLTYRSQISADTHFANGHREKTDFRISAIRDGAGANINVAVLYALLLKRF